MWARCSPWFRNGIPTNADFTPRVEQGYSLSKPLEFLRKEPQSRSTAPQADLDCGKNDEEQVRPDPAVVEASSSGAASIQLKSAR
jgi:hypothetical protein